MPRKTDGIEFEIHPRPTKGEDGKPLLYVRPAKGRKKSFKQLEDFCDMYRNLRTGELQMVFDVVIEVVGSTSQSMILPRNKTRFRPTAPAYQGGCSKI